MRTIDGNGDSDVDAPWAHGIGDAGNAFEVGVLEEFGAGVDVVQVAGIDSDGGKEAGIFGDRSEVCADLAALEEDASACIAALDRAVGVVPLVDPANVEGGLGA